MNGQVSLVFSTTGAILSRLIRWFTRSQASHVAIGTEVHGVPIIIEATLGGVRIYPRVRWLRKNRVVAEFAFVPDMDTAVRHAIEHVGDRFDYMGLLGQALVVVTRWLDWKVRSPLHDPKALFCSEFILHLNHDKRIPEWQWFDETGGTVQPEDFLRLCRLSRSFIPVEPTAQTSLPPGPNGRRS